MEEIIAAASPLKQAAVADAGTIAKPITTSADADIDERRIPNTRGDILRRDRGTPPITRARSASQRPRQITRDRGKKRPNARQPVVVRAK